MGTNRRGATQVQNVRARSHSEENQTRAREWTIAKKNNKQQQKRQQQQQQQQQQQKQQQQTQPQPQ